MTLVGILTLCAATAQAQKVIATLQLADSPNEVAVTPDGAEIYVTGFLGGVLTAIDTATREVTSIHLSPPRGFGTSGIAATDAFIYIVDFSNNVTVLDRHSHQVIASIPVSNRSNKIVLDTKHRRAYTTPYGDYGAPGVDVIDLDTNARIDTIATGFNGGFSIGISADGSKVYVANFAENTLSAVNPYTREVTTVGVSEVPYELEVESINGRELVFVACASAVDLIDVATDERIATVPTGLGIQRELKITEDETRAFTANQADGTVTAFDTTTYKTTTIATGRGAYGLALTPDGHFLAVTNEFDATVSIVNIRTNKVVSTLHIGQHPFDIIAIDTPNGPQLFTFNRQSRTVSVISLEGLKP